MKSSVKSIVIVLAIASVLGAAQAAKAKSAKPLKYLKPDSVNVPALLPDPPARGSEEEEAELWLMVAAQEGRSVAEADRAKAEEKFDVFAFSDVLGSGLNARACPKTAALFADIEADSKVFSKAAKERWNRKRPPYIDSRIHPVATLEDEGAYPSGHATRGQMMAEVLAELVPNKKDALLNRGRQIGWDRVIGGVHYPSDVAAGRVLGHALAKELLANPDFRSRLEEARAEVNAAKSAVSTESAGVVAHP